MTGAPPKPSDCNERLPGAPDIGISDLFDVIYCDPPWRHDFFKSKSRATENHYPTMTTPEICELQVPAADNCVLFMWATAPKLTDAMQVIEAWGFEYRTHAIWDKVKIGLGYWFRGQHELLMVATRGHKSPPPESQRISSVIRSPRSAHSSKPDQVRDWIAKWYPTDRKMEMFARPYTAFWPKHDGWETWGNELPNDVAITSNDQAQPSRRRQRLSATKRNNEQ